MDLMIVTRRNEVQVVWVIWGSTAQGGSLDCEARSVSSEAS